MKVNPTDNRTEIARRLKWAAEQYMSGQRCNCGEPIWIIGSAVAYLACFACITGSANPDEDYELDITQPLE